MNLIKSGFKIRTKGLPSGRGNNMKGKKKVKILLIVAILAYISCIFIRQQKTMYNMNKELREKQSKYNQLVNKNLSLKDEVEMSKTDAYIEKLARERLGLIKNGEIPVINNGNNN